MKLSANIPCPCDSGSKYKKCCSKYHKGALAPDALTLMISRYSAYATGNSKYIIKTTHSDNPDYTKERNQWEKEIALFCDHTDFLGLSILEYIDGKKEAYVTFSALLSFGELKEKSYFLKENGEWLYVDGEFS